MLAVARQGTPYPRWNVFGEAFCQKSGNKKIMRFIIVQQYYVIRKMKQAQFSNFVILIVRESTEFVIM